MTTLQASPLILTVPDIDGAGPDHWMSAWEREDDHVRRVDMGGLDDGVVVTGAGKLSRNLWVNRLNLAIHRAHEVEGRPVILVAHGVGCLTVAWWAHYEAPQWGDPVIGALLVAPPEVDGPTPEGIGDPRVAIFSPTPLLPLPFPSLLVAGHDDPHADFARSERIARFWGSELVDAGAFGHGDGLSEWALGQQLLAELARRAIVQQVAPPEAGVIEPALFAL
jgi:predicted alpha/beta hydrolase family esterase